MSSWNLRDLARQAIDHWYWILGFIVLGGLLGYVISSVLPAPYRAEADLYVGIDVTRVNEMEYLIPLAREEPLNLDDYKNWQLKQLADIFYSDRVLEDALQTLRGSDPGWSGIPLADFREGIDIYWYDTGIWRLQYLDAEGVRAEAAVQAWLDAGYEYVESLLVVSELAAEYDAALEINKAAAAGLKTQATRLENFQESVAEWLADYPELEDLNSPMSASQHTEIWSWVTAGLSGIGIWQPLDDFPPLGTTPEGYKDWLESANQQAAIASGELEGQLALLEAEREDLLPAYHQSLDDSLGLSANVVLRENSAVPVVSQVRNQGTTTLVGAGLGLLSWLIFAVIFERGSRDERY